MSKKILYNIKRTSISLLLLSCFLLTNCATEKKLIKLDKVQTQYNNAVSLNERYLHGNYGEPDPTSFMRLKQYRQDAYQALMQFREPFNKEKPIPQEALKNAQEKINIYISYLNALGATSATKDNFVGF